MSFKAHLEYIYHITCNHCKGYFTYAVMQKKFKIDRGKYWCPKCGQSGKIELQESRLIGKINSSSAWRIVLKKDPKYLHLQSTTYSK